MFEQGRESILCTHCLSQFLLHENAHSPSRKTGLIGLNYSCHGTALAGSIKYPVFRLHV